MPDHVKLTTADGCPVADNQNSLPTGPRGPLLTEIKTVPDPFFLSDGR